MTENVSVQKYFQLIKQHKQLGNAYLFIGDDSVLLSGLLQLFICQKDSCGVCWDCLMLSRFSHPDLLVLEPEVNTIKIEQIRMAQSFLALKSFRAEYKILWIKAAESLGYDAANAFLKTLEEPPSNSLIFLSANSLDLLLPTIVSRCRKIFLKNAVAKANYVSKHFDDFFAKGNIKFKDRNEFVSFLKDMVAAVRVALIVKINPQLSQRQNLRATDLFSGYTIEQLVRLFERIFLVLERAEIINESLALNIIYSDLEFYRQN